TRAPGRRPERRPQWRRDGIASLRGRETARCRALLPRPGPECVPPARRVPPGHRPPRPRIEGQPEGPGAGANLCARRKELRPHGEIPKRRDSARPESRPGAQENRHRPQRHLAFVGRRTFPDSHLLSAPRRLSFPMPVGPASSTAPQFESWIPPPRQVLRASLRPRSKDEFEIYPYPSTIPLAEALALEARRMGGGTHITLLTDGL